MTKPATYTSATLPWRVALWSTHVAYKSLAEDGGVEPHPISENPVFKAGRRTIPAASSSITGTPPRIRTENNLPFEGSDFARFVQRGIIKQDVVSKPGLEPTTRPQRAGLLSAFRRW